MHKQQLKNGMWQVAETDSDGNTFVFAEFPRKWQADEYIADCEDFDEAWEEMEEVEEEFQTVTEKIIRDNLSAWKKLAGDT